MRFQVFLNRQEKKFLSPFSELLILQSKNLSSHNPFPHLGERPIQRSVNIFLMKPMFFLMERKWLIQTLKFLKLVHWLKIILYRFCMPPDLSWEKEYRVDGFQHHAYTRKRKKNFAFSVYTSPTYRLKGQIKWPSLLFLFLQLPNFH